MFLFYLFLYVIVILFLDFIWYLRFYQIKVEKINVWIIFYKNVEILDILEDYQQNEWNIELSKSINNTRYLQSWLLNLQVKKIEKCFKDMESQKTCKCTKKQRKKKEEEKDNV